MTQRKFTCFKACDISREIGVNIDEDLAYRVGRAVVQHLEGSAVLIGWDARVQLAIAFRMPWRREWRVRM